MFQQYFPLTTIHPRCTRVEQGIAYVKNLLAANPENRFTTEKRDEIAQHLDELLTPPARKKRQKSEKPQLNRLLRQLGFRIEQCSHDSGKPSGQLWRIDRLTTESKDVA